MLETVLTPAGLQFEKVNEVYVIRTKELPAPEEKIETFAPYSGNTAAADFHVRGRITDANGPVADAIQLREAPG